MLKNACFEKFIFSNARASRLSSFSDKKKIILKKIFYHCTGLSSLIFPKEYATFLFAKQNTAVSRK